MHHKNTTLLITMLLALSACVNQTALQHPADINRTSEAVAQPSSTRVPLASMLLIFFTHYAALDTDGQKQVFAQVNQQLKQDPNNLAQRIKLAGLLSLPSSYARDLTKSQTQLQSLLQDPALIEADAALVAVLYEYTQDSGKLQQKLKDEAKKNEGLQQKLIDIKNIEKTMIERNSNLDNK